ncbi:MAG: hypothetical protein B6243_10230, partial [Anaerolineaceae bacterium 4572_5.2]
MSAWVVQIKSTLKQHWALGGVMVLFAALALAYSFVFPLGEINDEIPHFALVQFIAEHHRPPLTTEEREAVGKKGDASPFYHTLVALLTQYVDISDASPLPELDAELKRYIPSDGLTIHNILHTSREKFPFSGLPLAWHLARLVSIPLGMITIIGVYLSILSIYPGRPCFALAVSGFVAFLPRFVLSSAVLNDDNLAFAFISLSVLYLVRLAKGDESLKTLILSGVLIGLAAFAKYHSILLLAAMTVLLLQLKVQRKWSWKRALHHWSIILLAFLAAVGWWFAFLVIRFNQVAEQGFIGGLLATLGDPVVTQGVSDAAGLEIPFLPAAHWLNWLFLMLRTFWYQDSSSYHYFKSTNSLGVYRTVYLFIGLISMAAILGLLKRSVNYIYAWRASISRSVLRLPEFCLLGYVFLIYGALVFIRHLMQPGFVTAQGRHIFPALTAIAFFAVLGWEEILNWIGLEKSRLHGRKMPSGDKTLAFAVSGSLLGLSIIILCTFIIPVYYPFLPLTKENPTGVSISHRIEHSFADGVNLLGVDLESSAIETGAALPVVLYWQVAKEQSKDFLTSVCLRNEQGETVTCWQGYPVNGRYPARAWEEGYVIEDRIDLPTPTCLPAGTYQIWLSVVPLRPDKAISIGDESTDEPDPIQLAEISLVHKRLSPLPDIELWLKGKKYTNGKFNLFQPRQTLTAIHYQPEDNLLLQGQGEIRLSPVSNNPAGDASWLPVSPSVTYRCPDNTLAKVYNFVLDTGIIPAGYQVEVDHEINKNFDLKVKTRKRNFSDLQPTEVAANKLFGDELELTGYDIDHTPRMAGEPVNITMEWRTLRTMGDRYNASTHFLDNNVVMWGQYDNILGGTYSNLLWAPGEVVRDEYSLLVAPHTPPGLYHIEFGVYRYAKGKFQFLPVHSNAESETVKHITLGQIRVLDIDRGKPPHSLNIELGGQIELAGFQASSDNFSARQPLELTLYWQALQQPAFDYTVFAQLIGPDGQVWAQQDNQPQGGRYPTTVWAIQDRVVDRYELSLKEG